MHATTSISHYYPFGLKHSGYNGSAPDPKYQYNCEAITSTFEKQYKITTSKYNGKELQSELGLNYTSMDFRNYDNALGRFNSMDRLAELAYNRTPYRFAFNNPVYWSDPTGLLEWIFDDDGNITGATNFNEGEAEAMMAFFNENEGATMADFENHVLKSMDNSEGIFSFNLEEVVAVSGEKEESNWYTPTSKVLKGLESLEAGSHITSKGFVLGHVMNSQISGRPASNTMLKVSSFIGKNSHTATKFLKGTVYVSAVVGGINTYSTYLEEGEFGEETQKTATKAGVGIAGALAGGKVGAQMGAVIGAMFGGVGAVPGAIIGGVIGGVVGGMIGEKIGETAVESVQSLSE